jgi:hypothetical protein
MKLGKPAARLFLICLIALASGCASLPSPEEMRAQTATYQVPYQPSGDKAMVYVVRPSGLGGLIRFNVFAGDQAESSEMGYTRANQYIYFSLPPGEHRIYSKAENWADATVTVKAGDVVFLKQEPAIGIIMARNILSMLPDYEGKYHVKTLELGTILKSQK